MAHKTLIDGTGFEIVSGRTLVNGTGYDIDRGRTLVNGTGYDIDFGIPLGDIPVGERVFIRVNGVWTEFLVANQGIPSGHAGIDMYDSSCNGTWLLMKDIYVVMPYSRWLTYAETDFHEYLNTTFLKLLDTGVQNAIIEAKIPYEGYEVITGGADFPLRPLENGLSAKIFVLSYGEADIAARGYTDGYENYNWRDGYALSFFHKPDTDSTSGGAAREDRIAYFEGKAHSWYVRNQHRSPLHLIGEDGSGVTVSMSTHPECGIRPAMIMPFETRVSKTSDHYQLRG